MIISILNRKKGELNLPLIYFFIFFVVFLTAIYFYFNDLIPKFPCFFKMFTGHPCPTCGATRMTTSLLSLNILESFLYNPLMFIAGIFFIIWCFYGFYMAILKKRISIKLSKKDWIIVRIIIVMSLILNWIYLELMGI